MRPNAPAPEGQTWLCGACGRTSKNPYDFSDVSCFMNSVLVTEATIERDEEGRIIAAVVVADIQETRIEAKAV